MPKLSTRQSPTLPATSTTRVSSLCAPSAVTDTAAFEEVEPPSRRHSTFCTPDVASVPETVVEKLVLRQPPATAGVVLDGAVRSTRTTSERQGETLPALSTTRVCSVWTPSEATTAGEPTV